MDMALRNEVDRVVKNLPAPIMYGQKIVITDWYNDGKRKQVSLEKSSIQIILDTRENMRIEIDTNQHFSHIDMTKFQFWDICFTGPFKTEFNIDKDLKCSNYQITFSQLITLYIQKLIFLEALNDMLEKQWHGLMCLNVIIKDVYNLELGLDFIKGALRFDIYMKLQVAFDPNDENNFMAIVYSEKNWLRSPKTENILISTKANFMNFLETKAA